METRVIIVRSTDRVCLGELKMASVPRPGDTLVLGLLREDRQLFRVERVSWEIAIELGSVPREGSLDAAVLEVTNEPLKESVKSYQTSSN